MENQTNEFNEKIVLIDICGTLYDSNTTMDFLDYVFGKQRKYRRYRTMASWLPMRILNKCSLSLSFKDPIRAYGIRFLKGLSKDEIQSLVEKFYTDYLQDRCEKPIVDLLDQYRHSPYRLIIVSATLDCIAHKIAKSLNIPTVLSSVMEYDPVGRYTGRITVDLLSAKQKALQQHGIYPPFGLTISDNLSDVALMQQSEKNVIVCWKRKKRKWLRAICRYHLKNTTILFK